MVNCSGNKIMVSPAMDRVQLKRLALFIRRNFGFCPLQKFNPVYVMENLIPRNVDSNFTFICTTVRSWPYASTVQAVCDFNNHNIEVREDVYIGACRGNPLDIFTVCHEVCHYLLFHFFGLPAAFRIADKEYKRSQQEYAEWQANTLAGLLCVTDEMIKESEGDTVKLMEMSGLSRSAVNYCVDLSVADRAWELRRIKSRKNKKRRQSV